MKKKWLAFLAALGAMVFFWRKKKQQEAAPMPSEPSSPEPSSPEPSEGSSETS
jgi:hypothetical protein